MRTLTAAAAVAMVFAIVLTLAIISQQLGARTGLGSVYGVRFGMSKEATQLQFRDASLGEWRAANGKEYELLYWQRRRSTLGSPTGAAFVFHSGLLTAVRLHLDEDAARAQTAALDSNESVMLSTKRDSEGMVLSYALRLCDINDGSPSAARQRWSEIESLLQADPRPVDVSLRGERSSLRALD
jgi:hypothetical protein